MRLLCVLATIALLFATPVAWTAESPAPSAEGVRRCIAALTSLLGRFRAPRKLTVLGRSLELQTHTHGSNRLSYRRDLGNNESLHAYNIATTDSAYAARTLDPALTSWSQPGTKSLIDIASDLKGTLSITRYDYSDLRAEKAAAEAAGKSFPTHREVVDPISFTIDLPQPNGSADATKTITRVHALPSGDYIQPRIDVQIEDGQKALEIRVVNGHSNTRVEGDRVVIDDITTHGEGIILKFPKGGGRSREEPVVINASTIEFSRLTNAEHEPYRLLGVAAKLLGSMRPGQGLWLQCLDGVYRRGFNDTEWTRFER